jgi:hypothetical protein
MFNATFARTLMWCAIGLLIAVVMHYMLYRMTLPIQPFIYQAF